MTALRGSNMNVRQMTVIRYFLRWGSSPFFFCSQNFFIVFCYYYYYVNHKMSLLI